MSAPHLPPKSCSIETHRRVQALPWFFAVMLLSLVSGASAAVMAVAWVVPTFLGDTSIYIRNRGAQEFSSAAEIDAMLEKQLNQRTATIVDTRKAVAPSLYTEAAKVGSAALLSSDGWSVMYFPQYQPGNEQYWQVVDTQGAVIEIEKTIFEKETKLLYVKLSGTGFQVFSFMEWTVLTPGMEAWINANGRWQKNILDLSSVSAADSAVAPHIVAATYAVSSRIGKTGLVVSEQGQLVGFATADDVIVPGYVIMAHMPQVLTNGELHTKSLGFEGQYIAQQITGTQAVAMPGFYISAITSPALKKQIHIGDVIIRVNGNLVTSATLPQLILAAPDTLTIDVLRKGTVLQNIVVTKEIQS